MSALSWTLPIGVAMPWFPPARNGEDIPGRAPLLKNQDFSGNSRGDDIFIADAHLDASRVSRKGIEAALQTGFLQRKERSAREKKRENVDAAQPQAMPEPYSAVPHDDGSEEEEALVQMFVERQKSIAKMLKMLYDMQTDIYEIIGDAAARRFKVMEDLAEKWAKTIRSDS